MDKLIDWLPKNIPPGERTTIVHGDYRIDNMVLHPTEPTRARGARLGAVDARRSARGLHLSPDVVGDALVRSARGPRSLAIDGPGSLGHPDARTSTSPAIASSPAARACRELDYYFAYNAFRLAGILQGIVGRVRDGTASNAAAAQNEGRVAPLAQFAYACAQRAGMSG